MSYDIPPSKRIHIALIGLPVCTAKIPFLVCLSVTKRRREYAVFVKIRGTKSRVSGHCGRLWIDLLISWQNRTPTDLGIPNLIILGPLFPFYG